MDARAHRLIQEVCPLNLLIREESKMQVGDWVIRYSDCTEGVIKSIGECYKDDCSELVFTVKDPNSDSNVLWEYHMSDASSFEVLENPFSD